jgi:hypothetical protein
MLRTRAARGIHQPGGAVARDLTRRQPPTIRLPNRKTPKPQQPTSSQHHGSGRRHSSINRCRQVLRSVRAFGGAGIGMHEGGAPRFGPLSSRLPVAHRACTRLACPRRAASTSRATPHTASSTTSCGSLRDVSRAGGLAAGRGRPAPVTSAVPARVGSRPVSRGCGGCVRAVLGSCGHARGTTASPMAGAGPS